MSESTPAEQNTPLLVKAEAALDVQDESGKTALDWAKEGQHTKCVTILEAASTEQVRQTLPPEVTSHHTTGPNPTPSTLLPAWPTRARAHTHTNTDLN